MRVETARGRIVVFQYKKRLWWALFIDAIFCIEMCGYAENLSLWRRNSCINTRALYAVVTNPIARKGQGRNSLAGSRGSAPWVSQKKRRGSRELLLSTRFCGVSLRWLRRCTPAKCRAWIPPFQRGWSPARTRPRCTGCRGRSRSPCRNTRRTDAPAHASW